MTIRTRSRTQDVSSGFRERYLSGNLQSHTDFIRTQMSEVTKDTADNPGHDHDFDVEKKSWDVEPITGRRPSGVYAQSGYVNYNADWLAKTLPIDINSNSITSQDFATLRSRTNPSRPEVVPLTLLQDVVDIPRQLKDVGKLLRSPRKALTAREIANQNLGIQFGWLPLIDDAKALFALQSHIQKRKMEIARLDSASGLKRRIRLDHSTLSDTISNSVLSTDIQAGNLYAQLDRVQEVEKWGTIRWKPDGIPNWYDKDADRIQQIRRAVSGFTPEGIVQGAWDLVPWTWVVDWFVDVGSFLTAYSNTIPATATHMCVMRHVTCNIDVKPGSSTDSWLSTGWKGKLTYERKLRSVGSAAFAVRIPFIEMRRLSILGSLFVQRFKNR